MTREARQLLKRAELTAIRNKIVKIGQMLGSAIPDGGDDDVVLPPPNEYQRPAGTFIDNTHLTEAQYAQRMRQDPRFADLLKTNPLVDSRNVYEDINDPSSLKVRDTEKTASAKKQKLYHGVVSALKKQAQAIPQSFPVNAATPKQSPFSPKPQKGLNSVQGPKPVPGDKPMPRPGTVAAPGGMKTMPIQGVATTPGGMRTMPRKSVNSPAPSQPGVGGRTAFWNSFNQP